MFVDIDDTTLCLALAHVVSEAGWAVTASNATGSVRVSDRLPRTWHENPLDVLVLTPTPTASRSAIDAFTAGAVRSIVTSTRPRDLPDALELADRGLSILPADVVSASLRWPVLRPRLERTLQLILYGSTNARIAASTHRSQATVKRDVAELLRLFDVPNRLALACAATRLGFDPEHHRRRPD